MRGAWIAGMTGWLALAAPAMAADDATARSQVVALAHRAIDAFNRGDMATVRTTLADDVNIIDEMPPFHWSGPGALDAWLTSVGQDDDRMKDTGGFSVLGAPTFVRIEGDRAYAVFPDHFGYRRAGTPVKEDAAWTIVAQDRAGGWIITAWSYTAAAH
jgi:hypothetical protein